MPQGCKQDREFNAEVFHAPQAGNWPHGDLQHAPCSLGILSCKHLWGKGHFAGVYEFPACVKVDRCFLFLLPSWWPNWDIREQKDSGQREWENDPLSFSAWDISTCHWLLRIASCHPQNVMCSPKRNFDLFWSHFLYNLKKEKKVQQKMKGKKFLLGNIDLKSLTFWCFLSFCYYSANPGGTDPCESRTEDSKPGRPPWLSPSYDITAGWVGELALMWVLGQGSPLCT